MMFNMLLGAQLREFNDRQFTVKDKFGEIRTFVFEEDEGGCCGFNELVNKLLISSDDLSRNPVITKIEARTTNEYSEEDHVIITLFGEAKKLAEIDSLSSSGSGWCYGACVTLRCVQTDESECITCW
jgi:hypothetical protein